MTTKVSKEMDIEARPVGDDDRNEQIHVTSLVDEALKRVEIDRQSISSIIPLSPGHSLTLSSSRPPSLSAGTSYKTNLSISNGSK